VRAFLVSGVRLYSLMRASVEVDSVQVRRLLRSLARVNISFTTTVDYVLNRDDSSLIALKIRLLVLNSTS
jgi:hypothetical protein